MSEVYTQEPPFCIQIEMTEGCNLRCKFCGLNGIRGTDNDFKFLSVELANLIAMRILQANWHPRIEFAMHGEPSMNPNMLQILKAFRSRLGRKTHLMLTSNGGGFLKDPTTIVDHALRYVNVLAMDAYEYVSIVPRILERYKGSHRPRFYPKDITANPHHRRKPGEHEWVVIKDISEADKGVHATLNNHAGAGAPKNDRAAGKRCAKPFRELSIRWDGSIAICCNDWRGEYKCGNVIDDDLLTIWHGPAFIAARRKLYHGLRDFGPCAGCDALSYRPGLLPDKKGLHEVPLPTSNDEKAIRAALGGPSLTLPVLRPWELEGNDHGAK